MSGLSPQRMDTGAMAISAEEERIADEAEAKGEDAAWATFCARWRDWNDGHTIEQMLAMNRARKVYLAAKGAVHDDSSKPAARGFRIDIGPWGP